MPLSLSALQRYGGPCLLPYLAVAGDCAVRYAWVMFVYCRSIAVYARILDKLFFPLFTAGVCYWDRIPLLFCPSHTIVPMCDSPVARRIRRRRRMASVLALQGIATYSPIRDWEKREERNRVRREQRRRRRAAGLRRLRWVVEVPVHLHVPQH